MLPSSYGWGVLELLFFLFLMIAPINPAMTPETINAPTNIKNWFRTSTISQVQPNSSLWKTLFAGQSKLRCTTTNIKPPSRKHQNTEIPIPPRRKNIDSYRLTLNSHFWWVQVIFTVIIQLYNFIIFVLIKIWMF